MKIGDVAAGRRRYSPFEAALRECVNQFDRSDFQRNARVEGLVSKMSVMPVAVRGREIRPEVLTKHDIAFQSWNANERVAEFIRNGEPHRGNRLLEGRMIDCLCVVQSAVHIEDHGAETSWEYH
jgi:hypothetical protein